METAGSTVKMCRLIDDIKFEKKVLSWLEEVLILVVDALVIDLEELIGEEEVLILVVDALVIDLEELIGKEHRQKRRIKVRI